MSGARNEQTRRLVALALGVALAIMFLAFALQQIRSADFWWQLATGQWIVQNHAIPHQDLFSFTAVGHEWIEVRWLFFALSYLGWSLGGPALLILAAAAIVACAGLLVLAPARRAALTPLGGLIVVLAIVSASGRFVVRPEIVTFLMVALFLVVLDRHRRGAAPRAIVGLPIAQVLWTNMHTLFALGPVLAWGFVAGGLAERFINAGVSRKSSSGSEGDKAPSLAARALLALLVTAGCLFNPYGLRGALFPALLVQEMHAGSVVGRSIEELRSPFATPNWGFELQAWLVLAVVAGLSFLWNRKRFDLTRFLVWIGFAYLAAQSVRNVALFAFVSVWAALANFDEQPAQLEAAATARETDAHRGAAGHRSGSGGTGAGAVRAGAKAAASGKRASAGGSTGLAGRGMALANGPAAGVIITITVLVMAWFVATNRFAMREGSDAAFGLGVAPWTISERTVAFLEKSGARPPIFNEMSDGSYLIWKERGRYPVYIDGRNEVYGEPLIAEYLAVVSGKRDWDRFAEERGLNTAILHRERTSRLAEALLVSPSWVLVHIDERDIVFARNTPENAAVIGRYRMDPRSPGIPRWKEPVEQPPGWAQTLGAVGRPWYTLGMARSFLLIGAPDSAGAYLEKANRAFPDHRETRLLLAQMKRSLGEDDEADRLVAGVVISEDEAGRMSELLGDLLVMRGKHADAIAHYASAVATNRNDAGLRGKLAQACLRSGEYAKAAEAYRDALKLAPRVPSYWVELGHTYAISGQIDGALDAYRSALALTQNLPEVHYNMGILLMRRGDSAGAAAKFRDALRFKPDYASARQALTAAEGGAIATPK